MSPSSSRIDASPFARPLDVMSVGESGLRQSLEADDAERAALARLWGVPAVEALSGTLVIRRAGRRGLHVTGEAVGRIRQTCVVTLDEFVTDLVEPIDVRFQPQDEIDAEAARRAKAPVAGDEDPPDLPDPILGGRVDLGGLVAEHLALGLDPYPKKPGAVFSEPETPGESEPVSPFAVLGRLRPS